MPARKSELTPTLRKISDLTPDPGNARVHNQRNLDTIRASLRRHGQRKPIVIDVNSVIVAGNGTYQAAIAEGWEKLECVIYPGDPAEARAYAIADNRTAELASWDVELLHEYLTAIEDPELLDSIGFTLAEIAEIGDPPGGGGKLPSNDEEPRGVVFTDEQLVAAAFAHFRKAGFPYPDMPLHEQMQEVNALRSLRLDQLRTTTAGYHVGDGYHPGRFAVRCNGLSSPLQSFGRDERLTSVFELILSNGGTITNSSTLSTLAWVRGTQMAAQFRPGFALWYMRRYCPDGGRILDTSAGWGGRLIGYAASDAGAYVGIDPSTLAVAGNQQMINALRIEGVTLIQKPAEDVDTDELGGLFDLALTSPPYFDRELYSDEDTQSYVRYGEPQAWREGFLKPMLALQFAALKPGGYSVVNIADIKRASGTIHLSEWAIQEGAGVGFDYVTSEEFAMPRVPGRGEQSERSEPAIIFQKPA